MTTRDIRSECEKIESLSPEMLERWHVANARFGSAIALGSQLDIDLAVAELERLCVYAEIDPVAWMLQDELAGRLLVTRPENLSQKDITDVVIIPVAWLQNASGSPSGHEGH